MVTLLSIVNSDASDIGFGGYNESCQSIVYSDACDIGFGGYIVGIPINIVHGMWFDVECGNSYTWK